MKSSAIFDLEFHSDLNLSDPPVKNLSELIFKNIDHRQEDSDIILSHDENIPLSISLKRLRFIVYTLFLEFNKKNIKTGDTVLLASLSGSNELYTALLFAALTSYGTRVLMPMFMEASELSEWLEISSCSSIILPAREVYSLEHHDHEKSTLSGIIEMAGTRGLDFYDIFEDFRLNKLVFANIPELNYTGETIVQESFRNTGFDTEALLLTTSGTTGKSKIVVYEQGGFIKSCLSWQQAGFYERDKFGGRGFTPLFTHTMGIRSFFNALWIGVPLCLIKTEWFMEKPEVVRYFLMQMKPAHITGGAAVYELLFEIIRNFPELKTTLKEHLTTLISSGTAFNGKTADAIRNSFGLQIYNAFGTTENQQVLSTLLDKNNSAYDHRSLGRPLPGVGIGLTRVNGSADLFRMHVRSAFGMKKYLPDNGKIDLPEGYSCTGDLVTVGKGNSIYYSGRESQDFFKDGFGVKVPLSALKSYYEELHKIAGHVAYFPLKESPGLAALIFISRDKLPEGPVCDKKEIRNFKSLIDSLNDKLAGSLETFESRHRLLNRFSLVNEDVPLTAKGDPSSYMIRANYKDTLDSLTDTTVRERYIVDLELCSEDSNSFTKYHNPFIGQMLSALAVDKSYHRGEKDSLFTYRHGEEVEILDMTGGYGTNLLGHSKPEITDPAIRFLKQNMLAISDQGSIQEHAGSLAEKLNLIVGNITGASYNVIFGSTGSEAVEIAIHHAMFEWRKKIECMRQLQFQRYGAEASALVKEVWESNDAILAASPVHIIALKGSFHGSSSGARSLLGNKDKREAFRNILGIQPLFIDDRADNWKEQIDRAHNEKMLGLQEVVYHDKEYIRRELNFSTIIAAFAEPVVGEGGIRVASREALKYLSNFDHPVIMDEIQCGLGRCGSFLASEGIRADYYLFGKSLGGNVEKISAVLVDKNRYYDEFGEYYCSTFANGGLAAHIASKTLSVIIDQGIPERSKVQGDKIVEALSEVKKDYPEVIDEISGTGLMLGIRFCNMSKDPNAILRNLYINEYCGLLFSSYLLNKHNIRIFPSLSAPNVLRIEPSAFIMDEEINRFVNSIRDLADKVKNRQLYDLFLPMMDDDPFDDNKGKEPETGFIDASLEEPAEGAVKVALIAHFVYPADELRILEKEFCKASDTGLRILFNRLQMLLQMKPVVILQKNLFGGKIHFSFINVPVDSAELERLNKLNKRKKIIEKIQDAVYMAEDIGARVVSLGAFTSILSNNGLALVESPKTKLVTGNTLTAASGIRRITEQIKSNPQFRGKKVLGVVGASGNIGSVVTEGLLSAGIDFEKVYLIGRNEGKLSKVLNHIEENIGDRNNTVIEVSTDLSLLKECNIITIASNTNDPLVYPHHLHSGMPVLLSDLSVPAAVSTEVGKMPNVTSVPFASYIKLKDDPDFLISTQTPKGAVFCCVAEAALLGLEPLDLSLKGKISSESILAISKLADKYGFFNGMGALHKKNGNT